MKANVLEKTVPFEFEGRTYDLKSTFYVEAMIYDRFGGDILDVFRGKNTLTNLLYVLSLLINEAVGFHNETCAPEERWEEIDDRYLGRHLQKEDLLKLSRAISDAFGISRPDSDDRPLTDEEKNASTSKQE